MSKAQLTKQEIKIVTMISHGINNASIAAMLYIGIATVQRHIENARYKLCADNRAHLVAIALRIGVIK